MQDIYQVKWCFNNKTFLYKNKYKKYKTITTDRDKMENCTIWKAYFTKKTSSNIKQSIAFFLWMLETMN